MTLKRQILYLMIWGVAATGIFSCGKTKPSITLVSANGLNTSHNPSTNCTNCHIAGGTASSYFTTAGTIYDSFQVNLYPNTTIRFYTQPNGGGDLKYTLKGDAKGNFYTTDDMDFSDGLYVSVQGINAAKHMSTPVYVGQCNSCHNKKITSQIWIR